MKTLPDDFVLPFRFEGDPVMQGTLNKHIPCERVVLDTGAASTVIRMPQESTTLEVNDEGETTLSSLVIAGVEFGPVVARVKRVAELQTIEVYLGTRELCTHCLVMDYEAETATLSKTPYAEAKVSSGFHKLSESRGRPVVVLELGGRPRTFVLDTGSNANWLFHSAQRPSLMSQGEVVEEDRVALCGLGDVTIKRSLVLPDVSVGGRVSERMKFMLAGEMDFGGPYNTIEDGILGTGAIAAWHRGLQIIDFVAGRYYLRCL